ncbi:MAG: polysaccharide deacetylase family protein [Clostridiales bacterium]|nr:polysaccharide deacetylase family protein [Clostridiales bacterium]
MILRKIAALCCAVFLLLPAAPHAAAEEPVELPIIMYHHISKLSERLGDYVVSPETFENDLKYLSELGYTSISLRELIDYVDGRGTLPEKAVMITFDDGQRSFAEYALPLLEKYDMCAVAAIVGKYADDYTASGDRNPYYAYMGWPELAELANNPHVELQAHSYDMHSLDYRKGCAMMKGEAATDYEKVFSADLTLLNQRFAEYIGEVPPAFAYPFGIRCPECREILLSSGFRALFTCDEHVNSITHNPECLHELGRYNRPNSANRYSFFSKMGIS